MVKLPPLWNKKNDEFDSKDNYDALQLSISPVKKQRAIKPQIGHFKKANSDVFKYTKEIKGMTGHDLGSKISCSDIFKVGEFVDVTGITKGEGFAGVIKRYGHKIGPKGHGSGYHHGVGSMGPITQNRIFKHKKMPGRMGTNLVTIQNLEIINIDVDSNYVLVKGAIPGAKKGLVVIYQAIKKQKANKPTELLNYGLNKETKEDIKLKAQKQHDVDEKNKADLNKEVIAKETAAGEVAKKKAYW